MVKEIKHNIGDIIKYKQDKKTGIEKIEAIQIVKGDLIYITSIGTRVRSTELLESK